MLGCSNKEELIGRNSYEFIAEKDRVRLMEDLWEVLEGGRPEENVAYTILAADGREFDAEISGALLRDSSGNAEGLIGVIRDVTERKRMVESLKESEELSRSLIEGATAGTYIVQDGKFQYVSPQFEQVAGYTSDEFLGANSLKYVHPDDREMVRKKAIENLKGQSSLPYEYRFICKDGRTLWILERVTSIEYRGRRAALGSIMDITERKWAEEELKVRREQLEQRTSQLLALQKVTASIQSTLDVKGVLQYVAEAMVVNLGYDHSLIMLLDEKKNVFRGTVFFTRGGSGLVGEVEKAVARALTELETPNIRDYSRTLDEALDGRAMIAHHLCEIAEPTLTREECNAVQELIGAKTIVNTPLFLRDRLVGSILVFTEREEVTEVELEPLWILADEAAIAIENARLYQESLTNAEKLRESKEKLRITFESIKDGIIVTDLEGRIVDVNEATLRMQGHSREELIGTDGLRFIAEKDRAAVMKNMKKALKDMGTATMEYRWVAKDGSEYDSEASAALLRDSSGNPVGLIFVVRDITERKLAEEELEKAMADLERSNRELEQFAYVASHDLQEPLRMISSYTQLLKQRYKGSLGDDADEFIAYAVDGARRMQEMIDDLLEYSRVGTRGKAFAQTSCKRVLDQALSNLKVSIEETGAVITHDPLPSVIADDSQLIQLFQNLVGNAIKFRGDKPPQVHVGVERKDSEWVFSVRDNGIGIDPEYHDRIFGIFQRLHGKGEYDGAGIGLAVCKKIVERHGGRIWVESELGKGATFYFTIPL